MNVEKRMVDIEVWPEFYEEEGYTIEDVRRYKSIIGRAVKAVGWIVDSVHVWSFVQYKTIVHGMVVRCVLIDGLEPIGELVGIQRTSELYHQWVKEGLIDDRTEYDEEDFMKAYNVTPADASILWNRLHDKEYAKGLSLYEQEALDEQK